jgi:hypothetical protein
MQAWATVHESNNPSRTVSYLLLGCISHLPHSHPDQIVSGVYYPKVTL